MTHLDCEGVHSRGRRRRVRRVASPASAAAGAIGSSVSRLHAPHPVTGADLAPPTSCDPTRRTGPGPCPRGPARLSGSTAACPPGLVARPQASPAASGTRSPTAREARGVIASLASAAADVNGSSVSRLHAPHPGHRCRSGAADFLRPDPTRPAGQAWAVFARPRLPRDARHAPPTALRAWEVPAPAARGESPSTSSSTRPSAWHFPSLSPGARRRHRTPRGPPSGLATGRRGHGLSRPPVPVATGSPRSAPRPRSGAGCPGA